MLRKKRKIIIISITIISLILVIFVSTVNSKLYYQNNKVYTASLFDIPIIDHVVIIVDENKSLDSLFNNSNAQYINKLIKISAVATNYHAVSKNPYIALTSGSSTNISNSCNPKKYVCQAHVANITDEIENSGRTWKMYAESMPISCDFKDTKKYATRHNPFIYYKSISSDNTQCSSQIVPFSNLKKDIDNSNLPNYSFISPNLCNDMHNCQVSIGDKWLSQNVPKILSSSAFTKQNSLLIITWDEGDRLDSRVLTLFMCSAARKKYISVEPYNHYSILATIEYLWDLNPLTKNDKNASIMRDMLN